jgi:hypothetical protein
MISTGPFGGRNNAARCILALSLAAMVSGCSSTSVERIETSSVTRQVGYAAPSKTLAPNKQAATQRAVKLVRESYLGRAPYICTPSGFGKTSRCFLR